MKKVTLFLFIILTALLFCTLSGLFSTQKSKKNVPKERNIPTVYFQTPTEQIVSYIYEFARQRGVMVDRHVLHGKSNNIFVADQHKHNRDFSMPLFVSLSNYLHDNNIKHKIFIEGAYENTKLVTREGVILKDFYGLENQSNRRGHCPNLSLSFLTIGGDTFFDFEKDTIFKTFNEKFVECFPNLEGKKIHEWPKIIYSKDMRQFKDCLDARYPGYYEMYKKIKGCIQDPLDNRLDELSKIPGDTIKIFLVGGVHAARQMLNNNDNTIWFEFEFKKPPSWDRQIITAYAQGYIKED